MNIKVGHFHKKNMRCFVVTAPSSRPYQQDTTSTYRQTRTVERKVGGMYIGKQTVDQRTTTSRQVEVERSPIYYTNGTDEVSRCYSETTID